MTTKLANPLNYAGAYSLHLYCDHENEAHGFDEFPHEPEGNSFAECARRARRWGWILHTDTCTATCPKCSEKKK